MFKKWFEELTTAMFWFKAFGSMAMGITTMMVYHTFGDAVACGFVTGTFYFLINSWHNAEKEWKND